MAVTTTLRGMRTIIRRRGVSYLGYLVTGVALPRFAYRWLWGPSAPAGCRHAFATLTRWFVPDVRPERLHLLQILLDGRTDTGQVPPAPAIEALMNRAHAAGIMGLRHSLDELVLTNDGTAAFRSVSGLRQHRRRGAAFLAERDADRRACNARFGVSLLTEEGVRRLLLKRKNGVTNGYRDYAPIDFGDGLTVGAFVKTDSGTGRWAFFNGRVVAPLVARRRVLDLGSNNGSLPLMMLRAGARAVVAIEGDPAIAEFARLNTRILEWRDVRPYDARIITGDMRQFVTDDLGTFDVVTAFCSLYYLPQEDIARIIEKAAAMRATLIVQANESIDNLPARAAVLEALMRRHGYPSVEVHQYPGFGRPILVGCPHLSVATAPIVAKPQLAGV